MLTIPCATRGKESAAHRSQRYWVSRARVRAIGPDLEHGHNRRSVVQSRAVEERCELITDSEGHWQPSPLSGKSPRLHFSTLSLARSGQGKKSLLSPKEAAAVTCTLVRMNDP